MTRGGLAAVALLSVLALPGVGARAQEKKVTLTFTTELISQIATDNQGEHTAEIVDRLLGLSPSLTAVRLTRSGGKVVFDVTARIEEELRVDVRVALDKMVYYRMTTARGDVNGITAALQDAKQAESLLLGVAYRYDDRYTMIDLTVDLRPVLGAQRREQQRAAAAPAPVSGAPAPASARGPAPAAGGVGPVPQPSVLLVAKRLGREAAPVVDGLFADAAWLGAQQSAFEVQGASGKILVASWALWSPERVWILLRWPDREKNDAHKPWVWSRPERVYAAGRDVEDAVALGFAKEGRFGDCMLGGVEAVADLWTWGAGRTDPSGIAEDGSLTLSLRPIPGADQHPARDGRTVYVRETPDAGDPPYQEQVVAAYAGDRIPRYIARTPSGSITDVQAKGFWRDGFWTVEFSRALSTGDPADVDFAPGKDGRLSVAVFDHREGTEHSTSTEILFRLEQGAP